MIERVAVVVPAADEEQRIGGCLDALRRAVVRLSGARPSVSVSIVVVLDGCRDGTASLVATYPEVRTVVAAARCVGAARSLGTSASLAGSERLDTVWTAHTDADSQVPGDWLIRHVAVADAGADVLLGTVVPSGELPLPARLAWYARHRLVDGHRHVHGANLGIRASALMALGGWRPLHTGEDVDLAVRAAAADLPMLRSAAAPVHTSARVDGRAPEGFSSYLRALAAS